MLGSLLLVLFALLVGKLSDEVGALRLACVVEDHGVIVDIGFTLGFRHLVDAGREVDVGVVFVLGAFAVADVIGLVEQCAEDPE